MKKSLSQPANILETLFLFAMLGAFLWIILGNYISVLALLGWAVIGWACLGKRLPIPSRYALLGTGIFLFSLILRLAVVAAIDPPPVSDFDGLLRTSRQFAAGDYSFQYTDYYQHWAGQTGQVIYQGLLLRLWDNTLFLKLVNCLAGAGTDLLIYLCGRALFGPRAGCAAALLHTLAVFPLTLTAVLTNQITAGFFTYLALYVLLAPLPENPGRLRTWLHRDMVKFPLAGLCAALANIARPDALILLTAISVYCVFGLARRPGLAGLRQYGLGLLLFWAAYLLLFHGASGMVAACGVNEKGLATGDSLAKLVFGLDASSGGMYSYDSDWKVIGFMEQGLSRTEAQRALLLEELQAPIRDLLDLFDQKLGILWKGRGLEWALGHLSSYHPYLYDCAEKYDYFCAQGSLLLAMLGFVSAYAGKKPRPACLLPAFMVFAGFAAYLLIEVQPRYVYSLQPALYILGAGGLAAIARSMPPLLVKLRPQAVCQK